MSYLLDDKSGATGYRHVRLRRLGVVVDIQWRALCGTFVLIIASVSVANAGESGVRACFTENDDTKRLACYDTEVGKLVTGRAAAARVASVTLGPNGRVVVRLDNDEVWAQVDDGPDLRIAVGDSVKIVRGTLGSYWMSAHSSLAIKVRREQ
jgi:hypothetical protein